MKIQNALVSNILDRSQRYFAHVTTVTLSWRVHNIVVIGRVYLTLECFEFSSNFEFDRNMLSGTGAWLVSFADRDRNMPTVYPEVPWLYVLIECTCSVATVYPKKYAHGYCFAVLCCGYKLTAPVPAKQPWWIWINASCEFIINDYITTTKQSKTKPWAYFLGYTVSALVGSDLRAAGYTIGISRFPISWTKHAHPVR